MVITSGNLCEVCGIGRREPRRIREVMLRGEGVVVVESLPAEVCSHCEDTLLARETVQQVEALLAGSTAPVEVLAAPVYRFPDGDALPIGTTA